MLMRIMGYLIAEWPVRNRSLPQMIEKLEANAAEVEARFSSAPDTPANRGQAGHIIGIERWGQTRLRAFLTDAAAPTDNYDGYRPDADAAPDMAALRTAFSQARAETITIARELAAAADTISDNRIAHNDFGDLSPRGWLNYLASHAAYESKRLK